MVTIEKEIHLFPSRTQKLSSLALMILGGRLPGKVGRCRLVKKQSKEINKNLYKEVNKFNKNLEKIFK